MVLMAKPPPSLDLHYKVSLWEEPILLRPYRQDLVPLSNALRNSVHTKRAIAWLAAYGQAHTWQLQEALGISPTIASKTLRPLYEAGILARGRPSLYGEGAVPYFFKLINAAPLKEWVRGLSTADWLAVTGGANITLGTHLKHNVMVGDLVLKSVRHLDRIACAYGEPFSSAVRLIQGCTSPAIGDATLVRDDGLRIVVELTSHVTEGLGPKVTRWSRVLMNDERSELGLIILFLNAAPMANQKSMHRYLRKTIAEYSRPERLAVPGGYISTHQLSVARGGIYLADWSDWFSPGPTMTDNFRGLHAERLTIDDKWAGEDLINAPFSPSEPSVWQAPIRQMSNLYCTPRFLIEKTQDDNTGVAAGAGDLLDSGDAPVEDLPMGEIGVASPGGLVPGTGGLDLSAIAGLG